MKATKNYIVLLVLAIGLLFSTSSKADVFGQGGNILNVGVGLGTPYVYANSSISIPPIIASFEHGITDNIGIGGLISYYSATANAAGASSVYASRAYDYTWNFTYINIALRGSYHYSLADKIDVYGGILLGYSIAGTTFTTNDPYASSITSSFNAVKPSESGILFGIYAGGRYMFSDHIGAFAELGYSVAFATVGVNFKF